MLLKARTLLVDISKLSTNLPESLFISGVDIVKERNYVGGTFGDIFRSKYQGKPVALKRLRVFQNSDRGKIYRVSLSYLSPSITPEADERPEILQRGVGLV
jgi:hypothetical protein